jgi:PASTA domain
MSAYDASVQHAARVLDSGMTETILIATQPKSPSRIAAEARHARAVLEAAAVQLADARPPSDARRDNAKIVAALRFVGDEIRQYAKAAAARDWKSINRLNHSDPQARALDAAFAALEDLREKGHGVGLLSPGGSHLISPCTGDTVTAPSVIGQTEPEAVRRLRQAGLDAMVEPQIKPNPRVPEGVVVHESPLNFPVCKGTPISIVVSIGK